MEPNIHIIFPPPSLPPSLLPQTAHSIVCLDYIGHDFYVYSNEALNEIKPKLILFAPPSLPPFLLPQTADAIVCLDYIGHDFYVYRNEASNEINVVYKRKQGGVGVIEPCK